MSDNFDDVQSEYVLIGFCYLAALSVVAATMYCFFFDQYKFIPAFLITGSLVVTGLLKFLFRAKYSGFWQTTHFDWMFYCNIAATILTPFYVWFHLIQADFMYTTIPAALIGVILSYKVLKGIFFAARKKPIFELY